MKKFALVSLIAVFFVFAYAFTPVTTVVVNPELNSLTVLEDTSKTTKCDMKKMSDKEHKNCDMKKTSDKKCDSKSDKAKKCCSSKDAKKEKSDKN